MQNLNSQFPIVDPATGLPNEYFIRLLQTRGNDQDDINQTLEVLQQTIAGKADKSLTLTAGGGLTGGGDLSAPRAFAVGAGTGITVNADDVAIDTTAEAERIRDVIGAALVAGSNITITVNDAGDTITIDASGGGGGGGGSTTLWPVPQVLWTGGFTNANAGYAPGGFSINGPSAATIATTNLLTKQPRLLLTITATANGFAQARAQATTPTITNGVFRGRFGIETTLSTSRIICGLQINWAGNTDPGASGVSGVFIGKDAADTNLQFFHNDTTGTPTKVNLGANFPANVSPQLYDVTLTFSGDGTQVDYLVKNLITGNTASGTATTDLPAPTSLGFVGIWFGTSVSGTFTGAALSFSYTPSLS